MVIAPCGATSMTMNGPPICFAVSHLRTVLPLSWRATLCLLRWTPIWFYCRATSWSFPYRSWSCGMLYLSILPAMRFAAAFASVLWQSPTWTSWWTNKLYVWSPLVGGMFSRRSIETVTFQSVFWKQFCMPIMRQVVASSNIYLPPLLSYVGCFWFACLTFQPDHWFGGDMQWEYYDVSPYLFGMLWTSFQQSANPHHWLTTSVYRTEVEWLRETSSWLYWVTRYCLYPFWYVVDCYQDVLALLWVREWLHEVNSPYVKQFHL